MNKGYRARLSGSAQDRSTRIVPPSGLGRSLETNRVDETDVPMLQMTIKVFGWQRGQAEIDTALFPGDALGGDPFTAPSPEADEIFARLHARLAEEIGEAFEIFRRC